MLLGSMLLFLLHLIFAAATAPAPDDGMSPSGTQIDNSSILEPSFARIQHNTKRISKSISGLARLHDTYYDVNQTTLEATMGGFLEVTMLHLKHGDAISSHVQELGNALSASRAWARLAVECASLPEHDDDKASVSSSPADAIPTALTAASKEMDSFFTAAERTFTWAQIFVPKLLRSLEQVADALVRLNKALDMETRGLIRDSHGFCDASADQWDCVSRRGEELEEHLRRTWSVEQMLEFWYTLAHAMTTVGNDSGREFDVGWREDMGRRDLSEVTMSGWK